MNGSALVRAFGCALVVVACGAAGAARAQVAIAPIVQAEDAVHRDIAGEIALAVLSAHEPLVPQLQEKDVVPCRDDVACALRVARERGASHVVRISVAPLGARDHVVAVSVYAVSSSEKLFEENAVLSTTRDVRVDARALGERVASTAGLPERRTVARPVTPVSTGPGLLSVVGAGMVVGGAVAAVGTGVGSSLMLAGTNPYPRAVGPAIAGGSALTAALVIGGVMMMVFDGGDGGDDAGASEDGRSEN